ncbi:MAG: HAD family hydrolase, partial [Comamonas sp.]
MSGGKTRTAVRGVLFDLDGTLFDRNRAVAQLALEQAQALSHHLPAPLTPEQFAQRLVALDARGYVKKPVAYRQLIAELGLDAHHPELDPEHLTDDFFQRYADHPVLMTGAVEVLQALRAQGLRLALVSNGRVAVQQPKIAALGLAPLLDAILVSEAEGVHKPDPLIFQRALRALGLAAHEAVHV